jgi:DNA polymerase V
MRQRVYALIDCNNFFVSCERVFRPDLWGKPVVVLSNNDGCIVARSNEVKQLQIPMGAPYFQWADQLKAHKVTLFSGNFPLYGDFSQRVVETIRDAAPDIEVYSVDESFVDLTNMAITDYETWGRSLVERIFSWTGIPVSIGIAPTKTLAKAASEYVKTHIGSNGVKVIASEVERIDLLKHTLIKDVWGVGRRTSGNLRDQGIATAYDLTQVADSWIQQRLTIRGLKTVIELRGIASLGFESSEELPQSIARTRSFAHSVRSIHELEGAIASFAASAAAKLRQSTEVAGAVVSFIRTSKHAETQHSVSSIQHLPQATADTGAIMSAALHNLYQMYDPDFGYKRAGVILLDLHSQDAQQLNFQTDMADLDRKDRLMHAVDSINSKYATRLVTHASESIGRQAWHSKREQRSPFYTGSWHELPKVTG